jgi:hypothetical protein
MSKDYWTITMFMLIENVLSTVQKGPELVSIDYFYSHLDF